jgi:hypothetical protein
MEENGAEPEFVTLARELQRLRTELAGETHAPRRTEIMKEMSMMDARIAMARKGWAG